LQASCLETGAFAFGAEGATGWEHATRYRLLRYSLPIILLAKS
jgi:hypothetical protein